MLRPAFLASYQIWNDGAIESAYFQPPQDVGIAQHTYPHLHSFCYTTSAAAERNPTVKA